MATFTSLEDSPAFEAKVSSKLGSTPFLPEAPAHPPDSILTGACAARDNGLPSFLWVQRIYVHDGACPDPALTCGTCVTGAGAGSYGRAPGRAEQGAPAGRPHVLARFVGHDGGPCSHVRAPARLLRRHRRGVDEPWCAPRHSCAQARRRRGARLGCVCLQRFTPGPLCTYGTSRTQGSAM